MKRIIKSAFFITAGGALPLLSGVALLIPYTNNLDTSVFGELAIYLAFSVLVQYLFNYGVDTYLSVQYYEHAQNPTESKKFVSEVLGILLVFGLVVIGVFSIIGSLLFDFLFHDGVIKFFPYGFLSVVTAFFNAYFRTFVNIQILRDKPVKYFLFGLFNFFVTVLISTILVIKNPESLIGPMYGRFISGVLIFVLTFGFTLVEVGLRFTTTNLRKMITYCTPVFLFNVLGWVLIYINNYIINFYETTSAVGVYDFALKCILIIEYSGIGVLSTINPRIIQIYKKNGATVSSFEENKFHHVYSLFNLAFIALNILMLPYVIKLFVSNTAYYESIPLLPILCVSYVFRALYNLFWNPIIYFKKTSVLPKILIYTAAFQILTSVLLIKAFGLDGAVWSYFLVRPFQVILLWLQSRKFFTFNLNLIKMVWIPLGYSSLVIVIWAIFPSNYQILALIQFVAISSIAAFVYRKELFNIKSIYNRIA